MNNALEMEKPKKRKKKEWKKAGSVTVSGGYIYIADICNTDAGNICGDALDKREDTGKPINAFQTRKGKRSAVVCRTGDGDGDYNVEVREQDGVIEEMRIKFI